jgi:hypothetical protein
MAKIIAPNKEYTGISATVGFVGGVGETDNPKLIEWFEAHGYEVEAKVEKEKEPTNAELIAQIEKLGGEVKGSPKHDELVKLLKEVEAKVEKEKADNGGGGGGQ